MKTLRYVLGDQLSQYISSLRDIDAVNDVVLMSEVYDETTYVKHHKQKIILVLSAMRHFAELLRTQGVTVDYIKLDDEDNSGSFPGEVKRAVARHQIDRIVITEPGEWRVLEMVKTWRDETGIPVEILEDTRFICSQREFNSWAKGRKSLRMEHFYRFIRQKTGWLMDGPTPQGGRWNFDAENRKPIPPQMHIPPLPSFQPDAITKEVIALVNHRYADHFGEAEPFRWAVTRVEALAALQEFINIRLPHFGEYQDAMRMGEDFLFHSALSAYLNTGLLDAKEVCEAALEAFQRGNIPLPAVEGFIRQIMGWREFVRGIYWMEMPKYARTNFLEAHRPLPEFYWTGETPMRCLREAVGSTRRNAYAHHIQRLMITGNFALLAGIHPAEVEDWYLSVYIDAFEWVELPNTHGMALHADGGLIGSKPYAASGAYINRMSDYCKGCVYNPNLKLGPGACPFNYLYWNFMIANQNTLKSNPRMAIPFSTLLKMSDEQRGEIIRQAGDFLSELTERKDWTNNL